MAPGPTDSTTLYCPTCGYNPTGLPENRCPECGNWFDPVALRRALREAPRPLRMGELLWRLLSAPALFIISALIAAILIHVRSTYGVITQFVSGLFSVLAISIGCAVVCYGLVNAYDLSNRIWVSIRQQPECFRPPSRNAFFLVACTLFLYGLQLMVAFLGAAVIAVILH